MEQKVYYQVAKQGEGYRDDGAEDNPCSWSMVADTPAQLIGWLNDSAKEKLNEKGDLETTEVYAKTSPTSMSVWFRVLNREELATWAHIREVVDLRKKLTVANALTITLRKELIVERMGDAKGGKS